MDFQYSEIENFGHYKLTGSLIGENDGMPVLNHFSERCEDGMKNFIVDLSGMKHINSSGLGVLITLLTRARKKGGEVVLVNPSEYIRNLLLITKLNSIFRIFSDATEAEKSFA